jgi:glutamyl-tRNA synthetase
MKDLIEKHVLKNSVDFDGKVNANAVLGKVLAAHPELKKDVKKVVSGIKDVMKSVGKLSVEKQLAKLKKIAPELLEEKEVKEKELALPGAVKGKVVMRFAPSPSGPLHLGHAYVLALNSALCKKYNGKLILRIEDTNPDNIYDKAYTLIPEDARWLTNGSVAEVVIQSDRLGHYYDHAEKLVEMGNAYICVCKPDDFKEKLVEMEACECRGLDVKEQQLRYGKMFSSYKPGEAVLRLKTELTHKNPAMRDFALMRVNLNKHPRQKQRVWPLMNLAVAVDDHMLGITHTLRAKDHRDNEKRQKYIFDYFEWDMPTASYVGRIHFTDLQLSSSEVRQHIIDKKYNGWDDIRLPFLPALLRRGYHPDAFVKYALDVGISENDKKVSKQEFFKTVNHFNKTLIDSASNRYFFVEDPVKVKVEGAPHKDVTIHLHPDFHSRGHREFKTQGKFLLANSDVSRLAEGKVHRLMDCLNFSIEGKKYSFVSQKYEDYKNSKKKGMIVHWLVDGVNVSVMLEDGSVVKGKGESRLLELAEGAVVQFERFGFCRLDKKKGNKLEFWFLQR